MWCRSAKASASRSFDEALGDVRGREGMTLSPLSLDGSRDGLVESYAFRLYFEAAMLVDVSKSSIKADKHITTATGLITSAIKSPAILNFQEVLQLSIVQQLKAKSVKVFNLLQLYVSGEIANFKKKE